MPLWGSYLETVAIYCPALRHASRTLQVNYYATMSDAAGDAGDKKAEATSTEAGDKKTEKPKQLDAPLGPIESVPEDFRVGRCPCSPALTLCVAGV